MYEKTIVATYSSIEYAQAAALGIFNSHVMPLAMTAFDASIANRIGMKAANGQWHLAVRLGGRSRTLDRQVDDITSICRQADARNLEPVEGRSAERLWTSLRDFGWNTQDAPLLGIHVSALPSDLSRIVFAVDRLHTPALQPSIVAQPAFGAVDIFWHTSNNPTSQVDELRPLISKFQHAVTEIGGSTVVQRCPSEVKRNIDVWGGDPTGIETMRSLKKQYDPNNIMNPGRFVGGI